MANGGAPYGDALAGMLAVLEDFVPASPAPLPDAAVSVAGLSERSVGLGGLRGLDFRDRFEVGELKAIRLDALARWDDLAAPPLVVRGPFGIGALDVLSWFAAQAPTQPVSIARTFAGAGGAPQPFAALDAFLDAIAGPAPQTRHATLAFAAL